MVEALPLRDLGLVIRRRVDEDLQPRYKSFGEEAHVVGYADMLQPHRALYSGGTYLPDETEALIQVL